MASLLILRMLLLFWRLRAVRRRRGALDVGATQCTLVCCATLATVACRGRPPLFSLLRRHVAEVGGLCGRRVGHIHLWRPRHVIKFFHALAHVVAEFREPVVELSQHIREALAIAVPQNLLPWRNDAHHHPVHELTRDFLHDGRLPRVIRPSPHPAIPSRVLKRPHLASPSTQATRRTFGISLSKNGADYSRRSPAQGLHKFDKRPITTRAFILISRVRWLPRLHPHLTIFEIFSSCPTAYLLVFLHRKCSSGVLSHKYAASSGQKCWPRAGRYSMTRWDGVVEDVRNEEPRRGRRHRDADALPRGSACAGHGAPANCCEQSSWAHQRWGGSRSKSGHTLARAWKCVLVLCFAGLPSALMQQCSPEYIAFPKHQCTEPCPAPESARCGYDTTIYVDRGGTDYCCLCVPSGQGQYQPFLCPGSAQPRPASPKVSGAGKPGRHFWGTSFMPTC